MSVYCQMWQFIALFMILVPTIEAKFQWRDLTPEEITSWYLPVDRCALKSKSIKEFPHDIRSKNCSEWSKGSRRLHCGVGMGSNNYPCYGPYSTARPHFLRGVHGYTNFSSKPLMTAFYRLMEANTSLVFLGDSTTRQKVQALECELLREDPRIRGKGNIWGILPCDTLFKIFFPDGKSMDIHSISIGPRSVECLKGGLQEKAVAGGIFENAQDIIHKINHVNDKNVLVIANMGLWYNNAAEFEAIIPPVLDWLSDLAVVPNKKNHIYWHETVSQHWISTDGSGYFDKVIVDKQEENWKWNEMDKMPIEEFNNPTCCQKITNTSYMADWRNDLVEKHIQMDERRKKIEIVPFVEITRPLVDMHTCNPLFMHDCTHFCFFPFIWQPFWHQIEKFSKRFLQP